MTARVVDLKHFPAWPRLLRRDQAAAYVGMSSASFETHVSVRPIQVGAMRLWDIKALDRWVDSHDVSEQPRSGDDYLGLLDDHPDARH